MNAEVSLSGGWLPGESVRWAAATLLLLGTLICGCGQAGEAPAPQRIRYEGWPGSYLLSNGQVEAVVVPLIGRVMRFRFVGEETPFWEDPALYGTPPDPEAKDWINFGGDKTWPAPQADWGKVAKRAWPPPSAFDSMPVMVRVEGRGVVLRSVVDPHYGIRTERYIELDPNRPVMRIRTIYHKVAGEPVKVGVWVITQLKDPVAVFLPVPKNSPFAKGYTNQSAATPLDLKVEDGLVSLRRKTDSGEKIGNDASALLWVGERQMVLIESPREAGGEFPDGGASAEVWTNGDPKKYVELETLGPLQTLRIGDQIERTNTYTLQKRTGASPAAEARKVLLGEK